MIACYELDEPAARAGASRSIWPAVQNLLLAARARCVPNNVAAVQSARSTRGIPQARPVAYSPVHLAESRPVAERQPYGTRPSAWTVLEDKVRIDAFWDAVGLPRAPSRIVPADYRAIRAAADTLDRGGGTVWAADARDGLNGGGLGSALGAAR